MNKTIIIIVPSYKHFQTDKKSDQITTCWLDVDNIYEF